jgi:tetrahydromethanopterin S-methyltransferase subunit A
MLGTSGSDRSGALAIVAEQLEEGIAAKKCHACGCYQAAVAAFQGTEPGRHELRSVLERAQAVLVSKSYDCLGCQVCFPAVAENAFADAFPGEAIAPLCPTDAPAERPGWPPLPGDYQVVRYGAPVAVCTLNTAELAGGLASRAPPGLGLAGTLHTENLGIERIVRNVLANPHLRFLVVCGEDTRQAIGHLPGQSLVALFENGLDEAGRIRGAAGKRPILKNVSRSQVEAFRRQVELVPLVGEQDLARILEAVGSCAVRSPGPFAGAPIDDAVPVVAAREPTRLVLDPSGFLIVYPDRRRGLVLEHYRNEGVLDCVIEGATPGAVGAAAVERGLLSRLDHAVYLGRELARAEESLRLGTPYTQDRAPGPPPEPDPAQPQGCGCTGKT